METALHYQRQTLNHRLLDAPEETELIRRAQAGDKAALATLVELNQRLVANIAARYIRSSVSGDNEITDLMQYGNEGLLIAIRRFDPARGFRLSTYVTWWIRQTIRRRALMHGTTLHRTAREGELLMVARKQYSLFVHQHDRHPDAWELAERLNLSEPLALHVVDMLLNSKVVSLDQETEYPNDGSARNRYDSIPDNSPSIEDQVIIRDETERLHAEIERLPQDWRAIVIAYFGMDGKPPRTLNEIAAEMPISRETVRKVLHDSLDRLRIFLSISRRS